MKKILSLLLLIFLTPLLTGCASLPPPRTEINYPVIPIPTNKITKHRLELFGSTMIGSNVEIRDQIETSEVIIKGGTSYGFKFDVSDKIQTTAALTDSGFLVGINTCPIKLGVVYPYISGFLTVEQGIASTAGLGLSCKLPDFGWTYLWLGINRVPAQMLRVTEKINTMVNTENINWGLEFSFKKIGLRGELDFIYFRNMPVYKNGNIQSLDPIWVNLTGLSAFVRF